MPDKGPMSGSLVSTGLLRSYYVPAHMGVRVQQQTDEVPVPRS